ncbi:hypothetical protein ABEB36_006216 [Hypothenemus hampei]|uniref:N-acetyltransferase domain-containing protein n=1 Tax=Hypothenemus hampei TaxID=57062 RepID=A0ABD1EQE0_HYPHA
MDDLLTVKTCKYCQENLQPCLNEGLICCVCQQNVHAKCIKRGSVPGGLEGDLFFIYTCQECSDTDSEKFIRQKLSWLQALVLALYHLQMKNGGLGRNGFFHWRHHIVAFLDRNWEILFPNDKQKKKKWMGTVSGRLSHYSGYLVLSGSKTVFNKPAWWTLMYPRITPLVLSTVYNAVALEKQKLKMKNEKKTSSDIVQFKELLNQYIKDSTLTQPVDLTNNGTIEFQNIQDIEDSDKKSYKSNGVKRKSLLPNYRENSKKLIKLAEKKIFPALSNETHAIPVQVPVEQPVRESIKLLDPMCHYNTSLNNISRLKMASLAVKLTGGIRKELILSPYSGIYLRPYIRRDQETFPHWLKLMAELQIATNLSNVSFVLPTRAPLDFTYVQPEHIPAINSLCNLFFWPGIDLTESLQYPDYSCVALYKRLIVGFAFLVPDVQHTENYVSFMFTRPGWRNCGIAKFMLYHLIQTSVGKDVTLHVAIDNPALFLYQKFGFKVENVILDFYDKYFRNDIRGSKHAFLCRLER